MGRDLKEGHYFAWVRGPVRRCRAVVSGLSGLSPAATAVARVGPQTARPAHHRLLHHRGRPGAAAALRLLPRGGLPHRCALLALLAVAVLVAATGRYLLWPLAVTAAALGYLRLRRRAGGRPQP